MSIYLKRHWARIFLLVPLLGAVGITIRLYWNLGRATDLVLSDEAFYLSAGSRFLHQGVLPTFQYSPLYAIWYAAHLAVFRDPIVAYYAQLYSVVFITTILMYIYLRRIAVPVSLAFLATVLWIAQPAYMTVVWSVGWPRPYHFAFLVFLAGAIVIRGLRIKRPVPLVLAGTGFLLLAMAARTEYLVALLFFVCLVTVSTRFMARQLTPPDHGPYLWPISLLAGAVALTMGMYLKGQVMRVSRFGSIGRFWFAFGQHFSVYQLAKSDAGAKLNPWDDWEFIVGRTFPHAHSVLEAALANPSAFLRFELHNFIAAPTILFAYQVRSPYILLRLAILFFVLIWLSFITLTSVSFRRHAFFTAASAMGPYVLSGAAAVIPGILVTPKISYSLPLMFVLFVGAVKWFSVVLEDEPSVYRVAAAVSAVLISLTLTAIRSPFDVSKGAEKPILLETYEIRAILERQRVGGARIFQIGGTGYSAFLPHGLSETVEFSDRNDNERFWDFVQRTHIDAVLVDDRLRTNREYRDDSNFAQLLASPDQSGWRATPVGTQGDIFYLRCEPGAE